MNAFHVCGALFAAWAVIVAFLGITREDFPGSPQAFRLVGAISVLLALAAIASAVYTGATEDKEKKEGGKGEAAVLPIL